MQIVIDVPNIDYEAIMFDKQYDARRLTYYERVIANGIPLPENHGRIVDLDTVTVEADNDKGVLWLDAPTILKASYGK